MELGLIGASQVARLDRHRTEHGATADTQLWLATSRSSSGAAASRVAASAPRRMGD
jgi:hypothetical protein